MDDALIKKFLLGDQKQVIQVISHLYDELAQKYLGHLYKRGVSNADAEDIIQNVFLKIADKPKVIAKANQIRPYLWRMFFNTFNEYLRVKQSTIKEYSLENDQLEEILGTYTSNDLLLEDCMGEAISVLRKRSYDDALIIELSVLNGWSHKDVAVFMDKTYGAAREYLSKARKKLQELIIKYCGKDVLLNINTII